MSKRSVARPSVEERFWAKVEKAGPEDCWEWRAGKNTKGYGRFYLGGKRHIFAHRYSYELLVGPIPEGLVTDHLCRNPGCVNPAHLEPVTNRENILRGENQVAANSRKTHCIRGHEFTPENTYRPSTRPNGRQCRECTLERAARRCRERRSDV